MKLAKIHPKRKFYTSLYDEYLRDELAKKEIKLHIINNKPPMMSSKKTEFPYLEDVNDNNIPDEMEFTVEEDGETVVSPPTVPPVVPPRPPPTDNNSGSGVGGRTLQDVGISDFDEAVVWPPFCPETVDYDKMRTHSNEITIALRDVRIALKLSPLVRQEYSELIVWEYLRVIYEFQKKHEHVLLDTPIFLTRENKTQVQWPVIFDDNHVPGYVLPAGQESLPINLYAIKKRLNISVAGGKLISFASEEPISPVGFYRKLLALLDTVDGSRDLSVVEQAAVRTFSFGWKYIKTPRNIKEPYYLYVLFFGRNLDTFTPSPGLTVEDLFSGRCVPNANDKDEGERRLSFPVENPEIEFPINCPNIVGYLDLQETFSTALDIINNERLTLGYNPLVWSDTLAFAAHMTNMYGKENAMYLSPQVGRTYSYYFTETNRSSRRVDEGVGWYVNNESEHSAQRIFDYGFDELFPADVSEREVPVVFDIVADPVDPHMYVVDLLTRLIIGETPYFDEDATHIGFDYVMDYGVTNYIWYNLAVGKGIDRGLQPPLNMNCFAPYVAPPITRRLWTEDNVGEEFPLVCPYLSSYTYMEDSFSSSLDIINEARADLSLPPLQWSSRLSWLAEKTNVFAKNNRLELPYGDNRPISYNVTSLYRNSNRVNVTSPFWYRGYDLTSSLERQVLSGFVHDTNTPDLGDREIPVAYVVDDVNAVDPHIYVYDCIEPVTANVSQVWKQQQTTHVGFNYLMKKNGEEFVFYFNMVFGSGEDPVWIEELSREPCNNILDPPVYPEIPPYDINENYNFPLFCSALRTYENLPMTFTTSLQIINELRGSLQLPPLIWSNKLAYVADLTLTYGRENDMFLQVDPTRMFSYAPDSIDRRSIRVPETHEFGQTTPSSDPQTSLQRITASGFSDTGSISPFHDRELPVVYSTENLNVNPHQYIYDVIRDQITYGSKAYLDPNATHIGMNYQLSFYQKWRYWFNMVVGSGTDPVGPDPPGITLCFSFNGGAPQQVDPAYANPLTKACPSWPFTVEYPILCPQPYTYELLETLSAPIIAEMNGYRQFRGMQPLIWNKNLTYAAQYHAGYRRNNPGSGHNSPNSPYGIGVFERATVGGLFIGNNVAEGLGNVSGNAPENTLTPLSAWCLFKGEYTSETTENGHFNPFTRADLPHVQAFNSVGIGWTRRVDQPLPGHVNVDVVFVYGTMTTDNSVNAPALDDPYVLCT